MLFSFSGVRLGMLLVSNVGLPLCLLGYVPRSPVRFPASSFLLTSVLALPGRNVCRRFWGVSAGLILALWFRLGIALKVGHVLIHY